MIELFLEVPPQAQYVFSLVARSGRLTLFPSMPSTMVAGLPHLRISMRTFTVCCSMLMVPQTHRSLGRPQVGQTSAILVAEYSLVTVLNKCFGNLCIHVFVCNQRLDSVRDDQH